MQKKSDNPYQICVLKSRNRYSYITANNRIYNKYECSKIKICDNDLILLDKHYVYDFKGKLISHFDDYYKVKYIGFGIFSAVNYNSFTGENTIFIYNKFGKKLSDKTFFGFCIPFVFENAVCVQFSNGWGHDWFIINDNGIIYNEKDEYTKMEKFGNKLLCQLGYETYDIIDSNFNKKRIEGYSLSTIENSDYLIGKDYSSQYLIDDSFNLIRKIPIIWEVIKEYKGYFIFQCFGRYGLMDKEGNEIIGPKFNNIEINGSYAITTLNEKKGLFFLETQQELIEPQLSYLECTENYIIADNCLIEFNVLKNYFDYLKRKNINKMDLFSRAYYIDMKLDGKTITKEFSNEDTRDNYYNYIQTEVAEEEIKKQNKIAGINDLRDKKINDINKIFDSEISDINNNFNLKVTDIIDDNSYVKRLKRNI